MKQAILFRDYKKAMKCILWVHHNDKNMGGYLTTGKVIGEVIEHLGDIISWLKKGNAVYFVSTVRWYNL